MEIKSDENLLEWFLINVEKRVACINAQINDFEGPLQFSPAKRRFHPTVRVGVLLIEEGTIERATNEIATNERSINETTANKIATTMSPKKDNIHPKKERYHKKKCFRG